MILFLKLYEVIWFKLHFVKNIMNGFKLHFIGEGDEVGGWWLVLGGG